MITVVELEKYRLGNALFLVAAAYALALRNNDIFLLPDWKYSKFFKKLPAYQGELISSIYHQQEYHYKPIPYASNMAICIKDGYFQSENYFSDYANEVRDFLTPKCDKKFPFSNEITCSIHVRRGDYVQLQNFMPLVKMDYYDYCIAFTSFENIKFIVFSDDIGWCKENFHGDFVFVEGNTDIEDLCWMSQCTHNIIANSSFSWWAAWLNKNPNKAVYAPSVWVGPGHGGLDTKDLIPTKWLKI
jgi:hypothetical protein